MGRRRRRFLQDYEFRDCEDGTRDVVYTGVNYLLLLPARRRRLIRSVLFALPFILAAVILASGLDSSGASHNLFISLPIIVSLLPSAFIITGCAPVVFGKRMYNERQKYQSGNRVIACLAAVAVLHGLSAAAGIVYQLGILKDAGTPDIQAVPQLVFAVMGCVSALLYRRIYRKTISFKPAGETGL